jgi:hypothetical protein
LSAGALLVHGYHRGAEDAEIYDPGILKILDPALFPRNSEFFQSHAHLTLYPNFVAACVRITHLPFAFVLFFLHVTTIFLVLLACWKLSDELFSDLRARWAGTALVASLLTLPVAGTGLYILDQYMNPRGIALFAALFALLGAIKRKYFQTALWTLLATPIHPLMAVFGLTLVLIFVWLRDFRRTPAAAACFFPLGALFAYPSESYRRAVLTRGDYFLLRWEWYEWLGLAAPMVLLWWFGRLARKQGMQTLALLCDALILFEAVNFAAAVVVSIPPRLVGLAHYQPMRCLHLVYVFLALIGGGFLGQWVLRDRAWRWMVVFVPLCTGMFYAQRQLFPATEHLESPWKAATNDWLRAFAWIRENTPRDAFFALNPEHMRLPSENHHGFRALAERSMLAEISKDYGVGTMFPNLPLVEHSEEQLNAQRGWDHFQATDLERLHRDWGVDWVVLDQTGVIGLDCPYSNRTLRVCRVSETSPAADDKD